VLVGFRPTTVFGVELAYSGSVNEVKYVNLGLPTPSDGADIVGNGGHADVTFGLASTLVQPFVLAGVGITHYDVRTASAQAAGFQSDTAGYIPLGGGIRAQMGVFTADARFTWSIPFDDDLVPAVPTAGSDLGVWRPLPGLIERRRDLVTCLDGVVSRRGVSRRGVSTRCQTLRTRREGLRRGVKHLVAALEGPRGCARSP
jgi:hypothetical protein